MTGCIGASRRGLRERDREELGDPIIIGAVPTIPGIGGK